MSYDAFISYSHAQDATLAKHLEAALQRFAKPIFRPRGLTVFRDQSDLSVAPHLWGKIEQALAQSECLILLASQASAASKWLRDEVQYWKAHKDPGRLLIVLTDGDIVWDRQVNDFDWKRTTAVPDSLGGMFPGEPLWLDMRWAREAHGAMSEDERFQDAVARLVAAIRRQPLEAVYGEELRRHRKVVRLRNATILVLVVLSVLATGFGLVARAQTRIATRNAEAATAARIEAEQAAEAERAARQATQVQLDYVTRLLDDEYNLRDLQRVRPGLVRLMTVYFGYDQAGFPAHAAAYLERVAGLMRAIPAARVRVEGHFAEYDPAGQSTAEYALAFSTRRAQSLAAYLVSRGVAQQRITRIGLGAEEPLISATNPEERVNEIVRLLNSRAEVLIAVP